MATAAVAGNEPWMQKATGEDGSEFFTRHCGDGVGENRAEPSADKTILGTQRYCLCSQKFGTASEPSQHGRGKGWLGWELLAQELRTPFPGAPPNAMCLKHSQGSAGQRQLHRCGAPGGVSEHSKDSWCHSSAAGRQQLPSQP